MSTLMPFAHDTYSGQSIFRDNLKKYHAGKRKQAGLMRTVLKEFERQPSGIILPPDKVAKRFQGTRVCRIAWKIGHFSFAIPVMRRFP